MRLTTLGRATRAYSLPASIVPVLLGTVLAARGLGMGGQRRFDVATFLLVLFGAVLAHVGANVLNDYFDFVKGVDTRPEHGSGVITSGAMTSPQALAYSLVLLAGAAVCGFFILHLHPDLVLTLAMIGLACAVLYSALLKRYGLGEPLIILSFGIGLTLGAYGVQVPVLTQRGCWLAALYSLPICLLVDAILHANNLRDAHDDRTSNVRTMANLLSPAASQRWQLVLLFGPLVFVIAGVVSGWLPIWCLATLAATPLLIRAARTGSVEGTAQTHLVFGLLYVGSLLLQPLLLR
ncbi:MAG TPA: prenyltransferase [Chthoniobacterales bacterium]|jgi:1,4-dihydroxy-2-naphthoate octaprenyltransferase